LALFNYATKEIILKIVYYGPGLSGKTTNLEVLHRTLMPGSAGKLISLATESDRTLFFDFLPVELGKIRDFNLRFQLYTVPGQVRYNSTRKLVLKGADAVVFVADSQRAMKEQNIESFENMRENLVENNINPDEIPIILQYNKRDLDDIMSVQELNNDLNKKWYPYIEAIAINGIGVKETFEAITKLLLKDISKRYSIEIDIPSDDFKRKEESKETTPTKSFESEYKEGFQKISEKIDALYNEFITLNKRLQEIEKLIGEKKKEKEEESISSLESQIIQLQKTIADLSMSQREMLIQIRTVYDIIRKARLEKKGLFF
jgi:signal recognition particle receptor subunit beta